MTAGQPTATGTGLAAVAELAAQLRVDSIRYSTSDWGNPGNDANDHLIFSMGHARPLLYAVFRAGVVPDEEPMAGYRRFGSRLEGHPTPVLPWVDVAGVDAAHIEAAARKLLETR